jgi:hypothetical protein
VRRSGCRIDRLHLLGIAVAVPTGCSRSGCESSDAPSTRRDCLT